MVEKPQRERDWLHRYTSERYTNEEPLDHQGKNDSVLSGNGYVHNGQNGPASYQGAETIFDFQLPAVAEQDIAALQRRAEYLLDEMDMGAADGGAFERETHATVDEHKRYGVTEDDANGSSQPSQAKSQVLPEAALPSIRSRPQPPTQTPRHPQSDQPSARSRQPQRSQADPTPSLSSSSSIPADGSDSSSVLSSPGRRRSAPIASKIDRSLLSVSASQIQKLEDEIAYLSDQVNRLQEGRRDLTGHALSLLREASTILNSQPERAGRAEYNVRQVRTLLERSSESRRRSARFGILLLLYLSFWLTLCAGGLTALFLYGVTVRTMLVDVSGPGSGLSIHTLPLLLTLLTGGLGGVVGAIISLVGQRRQGQEFDGQYVARYIIQPIMGVILAFSIYVVCLLLVRLQGIGFTDSPFVQVFPAIVALPAGLWQEMVYAMLYRFTRAFRFSRRR